MQTQERPQVKKLRKLEDLRVGDRIVIRVERCPFSDNVAAVLDTGDKLRFINSYTVFCGDLHIGIHEPIGKLRIGEEGELVTEGLRTYQIASRFQNLNELSEEHKCVLSKAGYKLPVGVL